MEDRQRPLGERQVIRIRANNGGMIGERIAGKRVIYVRHELKDLEKTFARCGTAVWFCCVLDDINTYKGEPASWENARWTGVVEKRDGKWIVVSQHFSFASDK